VTNGKPTTGIFGSIADFKNIPSGVVKDIADRMGCDYIVANLLASRGIDDEEEADAFLSPSIKNQLPDPFTALMDMQDAVKRVQDAIIKKQKIAIFGDYDVDGACSSAILKRYFKAIGTEALIYIPDRFKEGYGPNSNALIELRRQGYDLVITVDCGTVAFEPLEAAHKQGLDIIVIDHHLGVKQKPKSIAVINPNRFDETSELTYLCGAGVVFMLVVGLNRKLREAGFFTTNKTKEPNLINFTDLVALATVCDVVPLVGLNRAFVKTGLKIANQKTNIGIKTLCDVAGMDGVLTEYHFGFVIGPRINAGGRIANSALGAELLSTADEVRAVQIASELENLNKKRKEEEECVRLHALDMVHKHSLDASPVIFVGDEGYHQGVIGITASRIKEVFNKPVFVMSFKDGLAKASCRSVKGVDIGSIVNEANKTGLLIAGGGHGMAAGYTCELAKLSEFKKFVINYFNESYPDFTFCKFTEIDAKISLSAINEDFFDKINLFSPFGSGNGEPVFFTSGLELLKLDKIGGDKTHAAILLKCRLGGGVIRSVIFSYAQKLQGCGFNIEDLKGKTLSIAYKIKANDFYGTRKIEADILDIFIDN
jgi:single-stranded-DNA-specific exonuclease